EHQWNAVPRGKRACCRSAPYPRKPWRASPPHRADGGFRDKRLAAGRSSRDVGTFSLPALVRYSSLRRGGQIRDNPVECGQQRFLDDGTPRRTRKSRLVAKSEDAATRYTVLELARRGGGSQGDYLLGLPRGSY